MRLLIDRSTVKERAWFVTALFAMMVLFSTGPRTPAPLGDAAPSVAAGAGLSEPRAGIIGKGSHAAIPSPALAPRVAASNSGPVLRPRRDPMPAVPSILSAMGPQRFAFESGRDGGMGIFVMNDDGTGVRRITDDVVAWEQAPVWSPDADRIAFNSDRDVDVHIWITNSDGTNPRKLTTNAGDSFPMWSSNDLIAFVSARNGDNEIYTIRPDGTGERNVTNSPSSFDGFHAWSPSGERLVFASQRQNPGDQRALLDLYTIRPDGSSLVRLTNDFYWEWAPAWSPDGSAILFVSDRDSLHKNSFSWTAEGDIYSMKLESEAAGGAITRLTTWGDALFPSWSPDGSRIVFSRATNLMQSIVVPSDLWVMDADGTNPRRIDDHPLWDSRPWYAPGT